MQTIKKRILVETGYLGANVSCLSTARGLVYVDSPFLPEDGQKWADLTREQTGRAPAYVISTDHHYDHVLGNSFLTPNVICHSRAARGLDYLRNKEVLKQIIQDAFPEVLPKYESYLDRVDLVRPHITFDKGLTLGMGDATIVLEYVGGHSPATIMIYLAEEKVLFSGDNVEGQFPFFGQAHFGKWKEALKKMLVLDIDWVVPGHGEVGGKEMVEKYDAFFEELEFEVGKFQSQGLTLDEMALQSKTVGFFPIDQTEDRDETQTLSWVRRQYKLAAEAVLKERK
ncbi:MAG: MBL fold metallo-hydrolase [Deltaproteobacteria bacterium]|nr:MBL fold metallo-hydrolase [Deltaproteobacteria bacterium]